MSDLTNDDWSEESSAENGKVGESHSLTTFLSLVSLIGVTYILYPHMYEIKISYSSIHQCLEWPVILVSDV